VNKLAPDELLAQATCGIHLNGKIAGTGWLASADGYVITAGHILEGASGMDVEVRFSDSEPRSADRVISHYDQNSGLDFGVLKLKNPFAVRTPLPVSLHKSVSGDVRVHGFGMTLKDRSAGRGQIVSYTFVPENRESNRLLLIRSPELGEPGYSGAAVFSDVLQHVVAIQTEATAKPSGAHRDTVVALPLSRVAEHWPELYEIIGIDREREGADYGYEIFLSYNRKERIKAWIEEMFVPELVTWLDEELEAGDPHIFWNQEALRNAWSDTLKDSLRRSRCLVPILTPSYFREPHCCAEWETFIQREQLEGTSLLFPLIWHRGTTLADDVMSRSLDFEKFAFAGDGMKKMELFIEFQAAVKQFAAQLATALRDMPDYKADWPVSNPNGVIVERRNRGLDRPLL
jgi:Trypsin-like peptidase domain/TIR domain